MRRPIMSTVALALVLAAPPGAAEKASQLDRFKLWNGCKPVKLLVEGLSNDAAEIGLREEDIETAVRSRLRGARIYDENSVPYLYVNINVVGPAFSVDVEFKRRVEVLLPYWEKPEGMGSLVGYAAVWGLGSTGTYGATGSGFILSSLARHTDKFIDEYLRVNANACRNSN